jgi:hypothetical protein
MYVLVKDLPDCHRSDSPQSRDANVLTLESLPPQPRLYNIDRRLGPVVKFYVFAYPLTTDDLMKRADSN